MLKPRIVSGTLVVWSYALCVSCGDGAYVGQQSGGAGGLGASGSSGASGGTAGSGTAGSGTAGSGTAGGAGAAGSGTAGGAGTAGGGGSGGVTGGVTGAGIGETCQMDMDCRPGLSCTANMCQAGHSLTSGSRCVIADECMTGLQCVSGKCAAGGAGMAGSACAGDADCGAGLRCAVAGLGLACVPQGMTDAGGTCATNIECLAGLACVAGTCAVSPGGTILGTPWTGVTCPVPAASTPVRAYFEVPGAVNAQEADFFRLPFPNDARRSATGVLDLTGFPTPGAGFLGYDPVKPYVDAIVADDSAWGAYPTITFRLSAPYEFPNDAMGNNPWGQTVNFSDITAGASGGPGWYGTLYGGRSSYVCENSISVEPYKGNTLVPGHTYAVWISLAKIAMYGGPTMQRAENFVSLLSDTPPTDPKLVGPYAAYKVFRDYIKAKPTGAPTSADDVLVASVFTVGAIRDPMKSIAAAIASPAPAPATKGWVKCGAGVTSPCSAGGVCTGGDASFDEYQALVTLPIFQKGTLPYLTSADGGDIAVPSTSGQDVCMSLTVPKTTMPTAGWPVVIYAHGTGGNFRSHATSNTAGVLSTGTTKFAVLGIDQVENNARRGGSSQSADNLFFNFSNPKAARGNPLQGAADQLSLVRLASSFSQLVGTTTIKLDPAGIVFWGHSQGATEGSLAMPYADGVKAVVLSGNGAGLKFSLLNKTSPTNIKAALPTVLEDFAPIDELHPVLGLLQEWIDPADPLHFARSITATPEAGHLSKHLFQPYGLGDTYAPPITMQYYATTGGLSVVKEDASVTTPDLIYASSVVPKPSPMSGNVTIVGKAYTLGMREYAPATGKDGHFVAFDVASANADVVRFLSQGIGTTAPAIGN